MSAREEPYQAAQRFLNRRRFEEAFAIYEELARGGDLRCQVFLGWMYHNGLGVRQDKEEAFNWFRTAARSGSEEGAFYCGKSVLARGHHVEALEWFHEAAAHEYGPALLWLGLAHLRGLGVDVDLEQGVAYLKRAAATGNFPARRELALLMIRGKLGISKIPMGLTLLVYALTAAIASGLSQGQSHKLMG